jgi:hypothetical protein
LFIPQGYRQTDVLEAITKATQPIFIPALGPAAGLIMAEIFPGAATVAVIFMHGSPGTFTEVGAPVFPVSVAGF